ncbi:hypothetical protein GCM10027614_05880 [Micromonospora vulcania]
MTTGGTAALVRRPDGSSRATLLELLFDVVFVAALALISKLIADRDSWAGAAPVLLMLAAIWWTWSVTSTTTDFYDPQQRRSRPSSWSPCWARWAWRRRWPPPATR